MKKSIAVLVTIGILAVLLFAAGPFYVLSEGQQAVITQFGQIVAVENQAGLKFKVPGIQNVLLYQKRILSWDGAPQRIPTQENQFIWVDTTARWRIADITKFYEAATTMERAYARLSETIDPAVRRVIANNPLMEAVRSSDIINQQIPGEAPTTGDSEDLAGLQSLISTARTFSNVRLGRERLSQQIQSSVAETVLTQFGIELLDVVIRQIRYSEDLTQSVYNRMITERKQIAEGYRSFGQGRKQEILGQLEREKRSILSAAYEQAEQVKGRADAQAADIYAAAYRQDPEFYSFWRALESYRSTVPGFNKTLTTDLDYFRYLYSPRGR